MDRREDGKEEETTSKENVASVGGIVGEENRDNEEEGGASFVEEGVSWVGWVFGSLGPYRLFEEEKWQTTGESETMESIVGSGCRRPILKLEAYSGMRMKKTENTGRNVRAANGAHIPNQRETTLGGGTIGKAT